MRANYSLPELCSMAWKIRSDTVDSIHEAGSGHPGGSLSIAEIMSVLYFDKMNVDPKNPCAKDRDRFVLSKGHAAPALYATLANAGYFDRSQLKTLRGIDSMLQGHPDRQKTVGVDMSTGSLGQGISAACGMAFYAKDRGDSFRVYSIIGDGECQEGQVWEAAMAAAHLKLDNLCVFLDNNNLQIDGAVDKVMSIYPIKEKFQAFGWEVIDIDGHSVNAVRDAVESAKRVKGRPTLILCRTIKGKGVSFMENQAGWHGSTVNDQQYETAMSELNAYLEQAREGGEH